MLRELLELDSRKKDDGSSLTILEITGFLKNKYPRWFPNACVEHQDAVKEELRLLKTGELPQSRTGIESLFSLYNKLTIYTRKLQENRL